MASNPKPKKPPQRTHRPSPPPHPPLPPRTATIHRTTTETRIRLRLNLDGHGRSRIHTGIPFLDHMLTLLAKHSLFDIHLHAHGDLHIDYHHTVEDIGIVLGMAIHQALGDHSGIHRHSFGYLPMDETLVHLALDISGRPLLVFRTPKKLSLTHLHAGTFPAQLIVEFLRALAQHARLTLHVHIIQSADPHHLLEAIFKALAKALQFATQRHPRIQGIPSSKGTL